MRHIPTDNIFLLQELEIFGGQYSVPSLPGMLKPRFRDIMTLPSWMYCFLAYIVMKESDLHIWDMLAYTHLIIQKVQRHGGSGWLNYDRRQQAAIDH